MGEWTYSSTILDIGSKLRSVTIFTIVPHYPGYPFYRRLGGPHSRSGCYEVEKNLFPPPWIEPRFLSRPTHSLVATPSELSRLPTSRHTNNSNINNKSSRAINCDIRWNTTNVWGTVSVPYRPNDGARDGPSNVGNVSPYDTAEPPSYINNNNNTNNNTC
jgi:hypothetical protein